MTQTATKNPAAAPEMAAQEVLMALANAGAFGSGEHGAINSSGRSTAVAKAMIDIHEQLTAYYRTLPGAQ
ncbi:hypothetical protein ACOQNP_12140 [Ectopseudomonas khazarica]|uniref:hypothetical protein n=1 Tax=Ectopseudomonas khazarica TaxID=2502979 RepID=UPI003B92BDEF